MMMITKTARKTLDRVDENMYTLYSKLIVNLKSQPMISKSTLLKIAFNTILGVVLVFIWLKFVNIQEILGTLSKVQPISIVPILLVMLISPALRAYRLKYLLAPYKKIALKDLFYLNGVAMMLSFFIPIRAGELAKGVYLNKAYGMPIGKSIIWMFLDRFIDFLVVLVLSAILLTLIPTNIPVDVIYLIIIGVIAIVIFFYLAVYKVTSAREILKLLSHLLIVKNIKIYFERIYNFFLDSFGILKRSFKDWIILGSLSILAYAADAAIWYFSFLALNSPQNFITMYLGQLLSALTYLIPAPPGYVGLAEASGLVVFSQILGINANLASAMVVLFHVLTVIFVLGYGLVSVYQLKINLGETLGRIFRRGD
jgi:uncharacterized protein (TIRG00374 family)